LVVRSFATQITVLDGAAITILRVRQQRFARAPINTTPEIPLVPA